ncbi:MAG: hypothetical protein ABSH00_06630 [Bryobacteraceae bacterium]|jgi:hypothetical protein
MRPVVTAVDVPDSGDLRVSPVAIVTAAARETAATGAARIGASASIKVVGATAAA